MSANDENYENKGAIPVIDLTKFGRQAEEAEQTSEPTAEGAAEEGSPPRSPPLDWNTVGIGDDRPPPLTDASRRVICMYAEPASGEDGEKGTSSVVFQFCPKWAAHVGLQGVMGALLKGVDTVAAQCGAGPEFYRGYMLQYAMNAPEPNTGQEPSESESESEPAPPNETA